MSVRDLYKRIASLTPEQRALLERKRERQQSGASASGSGEGSTPGPRASAPTPEEIGPGGEILAPLSLMQQRLWLLDQLEPGNLAFSLPILAFKVVGRPNLRALQQVFTAIETRHESLRTTFRNVDGQGRQVVHPPRRWMPLPVIDISHMPVHLQQGLTQALAIHDGRTPFDLVQDRLWRATLLRLNPHYFVLVVIMHHIISDGWSMGVIYREINSLYYAFAEGQPSPLEPLHFQYRDFARWQSERFRGDRLQREIDFWKDQLTDAELVLELPTDRPRPAQQTYSGYREFLDFKPPLIDALEARHNAEGVTGFIFMLGVWSTLLFRLTGQRDILSGSPIAGRHLPGTEDLVGFFVNTLVFRAHLEPDLTFRELLGELLERVMRVYEHNQLPFDLLVKEVQPKRDPSYPPVFQVMFTVQNIPIPPLQLRETKVEQLFVQNHTSQVDLILFAGLGETPETSKQVCYAHLEYNTDLFDATTMRRWLGYLETVTEAVVADPNLRLREVPLLPKRERHQLLVEWGHRRDLQPRAARLHELGQPWAESTPDAIALVLPSHHADGRADALLSYGELYRRARRLGALLRQRGIGPEVRVAIYAERGLAVPVAELGVLHAGGAYLPLDPTHPRRRLEALIRDAGVRLLLTERTLADDLQLPAEVGLLCLDDPRVEAQLNGSAQLPVDVHAPADPDSPADPANLAYLIYTSGSTGSPKGVLIEHRHVTRMLRAVEEWFDFSSDDAWSVFHSFAFDFTVWEMWGALAFGGRAVIVPHTVSRSPEAFYRLIRDHRITVINQTPSAFRQLIPAEARIDLETAAQRNLSGRTRGRTPLRHVMVGGEALDLHTLEPWVARHGDRAPRLYNIYGITETTVYLTRRPLSAREIRAGGVGRLGWPMVDVAQYVTDACLQPVPISIAGELVVGGPSVSRGYLGQPALTASRFVPDAFGVQPTGGRLYRSGDLVRRDRDGDLEYLGRIDHQVQLRGFRVELGEIEARLTAHPAIDESIVLVQRASGLGTGTKSAKDDERLVAYLVLTTEAIEATEATEATEAPAVEELQTLLRETLPYYMVPASYLVLDTLPLTRNGKVDRQRLQRHPDAGGSQLGDLQRRHYQAPRTEVEQRLAEIWGRALQMEPRQVSVDANFFELGGHSLLATQVTARIRETFNVELPLRALFDAPTIGQLAPRVAAGSRALRPPLTPRSQALAQPESLPLSFAQHRLWFLERLTPNTTFYLVPVAWELVGALQPRRLAAALRDLVARHESLRTVFPVDTSSPAGSSLAGRSVTGGSAPVMTANTEDGEPGQQILPPPRRWPLPFVDLSRLGRVLGRSEAIRLAGREATRPLHLETEPPLRTTLLRLDRQHHTLLLSQHHIATDGWSLGVLARDLDAFYRGGVFRDSLPDLRVQYADFALWQHRWLHGEALQAQLDWWRPQLTDHSGSTPRLELPTDRPRPPVPGARGAQLAFELPHGLAPRLEALAHEHGASLFMALLAGFAVLLGRHCGQRDLLIGCPVAGRQHSELEDLIGFFINTLALRCQLQPAPDFEQLLGQLRETTLGAFAHQDLPFEKLVEELAPERDLSRNPLFQVTFALQNTPMPGARLGGMEVRSLPVELHTTRFDLEVHVYQDAVPQDAVPLDAGQQISRQGPSAGASSQRRDSVLHGAVSYDPDLFDRTTIQRLLRAFGQLLQAAVDEPGRQVLDLPWLDAAERHQLLCETNDPLQHLPPQPSLQARFRAVAAERPDSLAAVYGRRHLSYGELRRGAAGVSRALRQRAAESGLRLAPDVPIGLCAHRGIDLLPALLGILGSGCAYLPLDPDYPPERLRLMVEDSRMPLAVAARELLPALPQGPHLQLEEALKPSEAPVAAPIEAPVDVPPHALAYVIYTSGSTGRPKGVAVPHQAVSRLVLGQQQGNAAPNYERFAPGLRIGQAANTSFDAATYELWGPLLHGGTVVGIRKEILLSPPQLARALRRLRLDSLFLVTAVFHRIADAVPNAFAGLRHLHWGGEAVDPRRVRRVLDAGPPRHLNHVYGPTENTTFTTWHPVTDASSFQPLGTRPVPMPATVPIGQPLVHTSVHVLDARFHLVPLGVPGELCTGGDGLARGYLGRPGLTATVFVPTPFGTAGSRLYRSGDLVRRRGDGAIEFVGRVDQQVKIRGFRVEPDEVATRLSEHPGVRQAAVIAWRPPTANTVDNTADSAAGSTGTDGAKSRDLRLVAYVTALAGTLLNTAELRAWLGERLPEYLVPAAFVFLDELPLTANGKLDQRALPQPEVEGGSRQTNTSGVAPRDAVEEALVEIWAELLERPRSGPGRVRIHDDFFDLGGHSLLATQTISRLRQVFGVEVPLRKLFEAPTVSHLAGVVREALRGQAEAAATEGSPASSLVPALIPALQAAERGSPLPLSFGQQRLWFLEQIDAAGEAYHMPAFCALRGRLLVPALAAAVGAVVHRHEVLRTAYQGRGEDASQVVLPPPKRVVLPLIDLSGLDAERRETLLQQLSERDFRRRFPLEHLPLDHEASGTYGQLGPVMRATLLRVEPQRHALLLAFHHIACDGWSLSVFYRELGALYRAATTAGASMAGASTAAASTTPASTVEAQTPARLAATLPALPVQYGDYAAWQRAWMDGPVLRGQLDYWLDQLRGAPTVLDLPADRPRRTSQARRTAQAQTELTAGRAHLQLPLELQERLHRLGRKAGTTLFMTLLAAFQLLLGRLAGQQDVLIGSPIAGRTRREIEGLIGFFINSLVLRGDLRPEAVGKDAGADEGEGTGTPSRTLSFEELLQRTRERVLGAYAHQEVPFEKLVEELNPERSLSYTPLFQVFFNLINLPPAPMELPGVTFEMLDFGDPVSKFDLNLYILESSDPASDGGGIHLHLHYSRARFDAARMDELLRQYQGLLEAMCAAPERDVYSVSLVTAEARQLLPDPTRSLPPEISEETAQLQVARSAGRVPERIALSYRRDSGPAGRPWFVSYGALSERSQALTRELQQRGVQPRQPVAVVARRGPALVEAVLGVLGANAVLVLLDAAYPAARLDALLQRVRPALRLDAGRTRVRVGEALPEARPPIEVESSGHSNTHDAIQHPAYIAFTSGSTGEPKAVLGEAAPLARFLRWQLNTFGLASDAHPGAPASAQAPIRRGAALSGIGHDPLLRDLFTSLSGGGTVCLPDADVHADPARLAVWLAEEAIDFLHLTPALGQLLATAPMHPLPCLDRAFFGGDVLTAGDVAALRKRAPRVRAVNFYGATETPQVQGWWSVPDQFGADGLGLGASASLGGAAPLGRGVDAVETGLLTQLLVLAPLGQLGGQHWGQQCGIGEAGEIFVRGTQLARGFLDDPEASAQRFPLRDGARLYRTGDLGRSLPDGNVEFLGRADRQLKVRGFRVEPAEIEAVLAEHPAVQAAAVIPTGGQDGSELRLVAAVEAVPPPYEGMTIELDGDALRAWLGERLPAYEVPASVVQLERLARTASGKLDRRELAQQLAATHGASAPPAEPRNAVEQTLVDIWQRLLEREDVGIFSNFFDLGGHSLLAARLISAVRDEFALELPLRALFETPTLADLAARIVESTAQHLRTPSDSGDDLQDLLAEIENLSDDEVDARLTPQ